MKLSQADNQQGGSHYGGSLIDPASYNEENFPGWWSGNVVKYVTRHDKKNGEKDLDKATHYLQMMYLKYYGVEIQITKTKVPNEQSSSCTSVLSSYLCFFMRLLRFKKQ